MKIFTKLPLVTLIIVFLFSAAAAQSKKHHRKLTGDQMITVLLNSSQIPGAFGDDGLFMNGVSDDLKRILDLGKAAIPLLIRHLDDKLVFKHMKEYGDPNNPVAVTASDGAVDILTTIIRNEAPVVDMKCFHNENRVPEDDCVEQRFYSGRNLKRNWLKAYRAGKLHYQRYEY